MIIAILEFLVGIGLFLLGLYNLSFYINAYITDNYKQNFDVLLRQDSVAIATGITMSILVQSSSVVNSISINMVDKKLLSLRNAFLVVLGSDIGTTATGYIIIYSGRGVSLVLSSLIFVALIVALLCKSQNIKNIALAISGFSLLFIGLSSVSASLVPFEEPARQMLANGGSGILLFIYGVLLTAVFQSSALIMAIMLTFASSNIIGFELACFVVIGMNIGTTSTGFLASLGGSRDASAVALFLLSFNVFGGVVMAFFLLTGLIDKVFSFFTLETAVKIALFHTIFNVITAIMTYFMVDKLVLMYQKQKA